MKRVSLIGACVLGVVGCGTPAHFDPDKPATSNVKGKQDGKFEAWGANDAPTIFNPTGLKMKMGELPDSGQATNIPWAASYWPVYEDNINYKWDGPSSESAPKKYERAFGLTGVEDAVSRYHGIDSQGGRKECADTSECSDLKDGSQCAKRGNAAKGRCIPTWWGICHAWAPASILLPEPKNPVTRNGVTFKVNDIKALVELVHNSTSSKFVSLRCNKEDTREGLPESSTINYDNYGRPVDEDRECRDTNAGTYHVLLANYLGILKQSFVEDRTFNYEVWNQPLRGYRITQKLAVDAVKANQLIGVTSVGGTTVNNNGAVAKDVWSHFGPFTVAAGANYLAKLSGDNDADMYVNFGAQPTDSTYNCRPYAGGSDERCEGTVPAGQTQMFVSVKGYAANSTFQLAVTTGGSVPSSYVFNANAKKFFHVKMEVDYIGESASSVDGHLTPNIDRYTHTDYYEYVLETDINETILGGEWIGSSKKSHPDFLWLPTGVSGSSVAGGKITYAQVKSLLDESIGPQNPNPMGQEKTVTDNGSITRGAWKNYGPFDVAAGANLVATMTGTGDADLYVRKNAAPSLTGYDCRPYADGSSETCTIVGPAKVYVGVQGYADSSTFSITIKYREGGGTVTPPNPPAFAHLNQSGSVALGEMKMFPLPMPAGKKVVIKTTSSVDVDLYILWNGQPTTESYLARGYTSSGNETLTYTAGENGTLFVGVHGYAAGSFALKTTDN